jgi:hypothetical protein
MKKMPKKDLFPAQLKMLKEFKEKKYVEKKKKIYRKECERGFCNEGCKDTIFQDGSTIPTYFDKKYKNDKSGLQSLKERRTLLFNGKKTVLKDNFFKRLTKKQVTQLKKQGAISGCAQIL